MLKDHLHTYYFEQNYNCAESLLHAANDYYQLGIEERDMILAAGFGAGIQTGNVCGAVLAAVSVLSLKFVEAKAHESEAIKPMVMCFLERFQKKLQAGTLCRDIRPLYFRENVRCLRTVEAACDALEETIAQPVVSVETMRRSDAWTIANEVPSKELMRRAGQGIFDAADWKEPVAVVCGKGNNAGDGYVAAALMKEAGIDCTVILASEQFSEDGKYYYDQCIKKDVRTEPYRDDMDFAKYGSILDCLLGTGFRGDVQGVMKDIIEKINQSGAYVVSADINSGLNGDTGEGEVFVRSDLTVSIGAYKYGHFLGNAAEAMKDKTNCDIGIRIQPLEIERKYLICYPDLKMLDEICSSHADITQIYLKSEDGTSRRIRRMETPEGVQYWYNEKTRLSDTTRIERETTVSEETFQNYLREADPSCSRIQKRRYYLPYGQHVFEIDIHPEWNDKAVMEVELKHENAPIDFPPQIEILQEVTSDRRYTNASLAKYGFDL